MSTAQGLLRRRWLLLARIEHLPKPPCSADQVCCLKHAKVLVSPNFRSADVVGAGLRGPEEAPRLIEPWIGVHLR